MTSFEREHLTPTFELLQAETQELREMIKGEKKHWAGFRVYQLDEKQEQKVETKEQEIEQKRLVSEQ